MGSIGLGLVSVFSLQTSVSGRLTDSGYAQTVSSTFIRDVQSASILTQQSTLQCGPVGLTQLLGLAWNGDSSSSSPTKYNTWVSYAVKLNGVGATSYSLYRDFCTGGSSTPTNSMVISSDVNPSVAMTPPVVCDTSLSCSTSLFSSSWTSTASVTSVTWPILETLSTVPGSSSKFSFTLGATPRMLGNTSDTPPNSLAHSPLTLFGFSGPCPQPNSVLTVGGSNAGSYGVSIYVNGVTGGTYGAVTIGSSCPNSVQIANTGILNASGVYTPNPTVNLFSTGGGNPGTPPPPEYSTNATVPDPFVAPSGTTLTAPTFSGLSTVTCTKSGRIYNCPPGKYATDPGLPLGTGDSINFNSGGTFYFSKGFTLTNGITANLSQGIYVFDKNAAGYSLDTGNNDTITSISGALLYINSGQFLLGNGSQTNLPPLPQTYNGGGVNNFYGVSVWDAASNGQNLPLTLASSSNNSTFTGGGLYVPNGGIVDNNNGALTITFIVAQWASFANGLTVQVLGPGP
jgi:hypothetical protein